MKSKDKGIGFYIVWYTNVVLSTAFSYYCMQELASNRCQPFLLASTLELYPYLSLYLLTHAIMRWVFQELQEGRPALQPLGKCLDNVINNCVLYTVMFSGLLFSGKHEGIYSEEELVKLAQLFLWGRVIFSGGYLLGTAIGAQSLRSYGFGLCIGATASLIAPFFGSSFLAHFK